MKSALENINQIVATTLTDDRGQYQFLNLRPGKYQVRCQIPGQLVYYPDREQAKTFTVSVGQQHRDINFHQPAFKKGFWRTYTTYDGLAGNQVNHILRDNEGNLWFATNKGASKFDGTQFVNYSKDNGLIDNSVFKIHQTSDGAIWFATSKGLTKLEGESFSHLTSDEGLLDAYINDFLLMPMASSGSDLVLSGNNLVVLPDMMERTSNITVRMMAWRLMWYKLSFKTATG